MSGETLSKRRQERSGEQEQLWERRWETDHCPVCGSNRTTDADWISDENGDEYPVGIRCGACGFNSEDWEWD